MTIQEAKDIATAHIASADQIRELEAQLQSARGALKRIENANNARISRPARHDLIRLILAQVADRAGPTVFGHEAA